MCSNLKYALITTVGVLAILTIFGMIVCMN